MSERIATAAIALLCLSIAFCVGSVIYARGDAAAVSAAAGLPRTGMRVPTLVGYSANLHTLRPEKAGTCTLIHYSASGCEYCRAGDAAWRRASDLAMNLGCGSLTVVPDVEAEPPPPVIGMPMVYLPLSWASVVPLRAAPTTVLLYRHRRLAWAHVGALDPALERALKSAITKASGG